MKTVLPEELDMKGLTPREINEHVEKVLAAITEKFGVERIPTIGCVLGTINHMFAGLEHEEVKFVIEKLNEQERIQNDLNPSN